MLIVHCSRLLLESSGTYLCGYGDGMFLDDSYAGSPYSTAAVIYFAIVFESHLYIKAIAQRLVQY